LRENDIDIQTEVLLRVIPTFIQERDTRTHTDVIPSYKKEIQTHRSNSFIQERDTNTQKLYVHTRKKFTHRCANAALFQNIIRIQH
jgi:hypothetical protein